MKTLLRVMCTGGAAIAAAVMISCGGGGNQGEVKQAVHDVGLFELDRDVADDAAVTGLDWASLYPSHANFTFLADAPGVLPLQIFTGGGSKDDLDVPSWAWSGTENVPDKDQIMDAYAYYQTLDTPSGEQKILYFGLDRFDNNGTANAGWWFFQNAVGPIGPATGGTFSGTHTCGDILVQATFTGGGKVDSVTVFQWAGPGCPGYPDPQYGTLQKIAPPPGATVDCSSAGLAGDEVCATVNQSPTPSTAWPFRAKNSKLANNIFDTGTFIEGGINLTSIGVAAECFSTFLAETRSSEPFNSVLKDFAMGPFVTCDDGDVCTTDACDPTTGCVHTPISCDDSNACTADACDPATGCTHTAISCDDSNACTADACDPATGCTHTAISCDDSNACTADACDPATGCTHSAISCDDGNACTADACDPATGCTHSAIVCSDGSACTTDTCDPAIGCVYTPVGCDDGNACTADACDPATGCTHSAISCDDGDACTADACDPATGCTHSAITCNDGDACTADACDPATGCTTSPISCDDSDACTTDACDPATGCIHGSISCDDGDACTADACDPATGCTHTPLPCGEWCSPGYYAQNPTCAEVPLNTCYAAVATGACATALKTTAGGTGEGGCVTLGDVLGSPAVYGGEAFNCVGDIESAADPDINYSGDRVPDSCPLNGQNSSNPCARK